MPRLVYPDFCPDCGHDLSYSRRRGWAEKIVAFFKIGVFRCHRCNARFYSVPALIAHGRTTTHDHKRVRPEHVDADVLRDPTMALAEKRTQAESVEVKVAPVSVKAWPAGRNDWTQQAVTNTPSGTPSVWLRSSTANCGDDSV